MTAALARVRAQKLFRLAVRPRLWSAARRGTFPAVEHAHIPFRSDFRTVFDVGASRGQFATFAVYRWRRAEIVCFEPLDAARSVLRQMLLNHSAIVHGTALGATAGERTFHVSAADDSSSLLALTTRQIEEFPGTASVSTVSVPVATLNEYLSADTRRPVLLKVDVQGAELEVLRGAGSSLQFVDEVYVEASFVELYENQALADEVVCHLYGAGFSLAGIFNVSAGRDRQCLQADLLFRRAAS